MAETLNEQMQIADVYAAALFELAQEAGRVEAVRRELDELVKLESSSR
ncbi:MAG: F0F1 ATP synthase subunit delta, partial [Planctomycetota bacterium]